MLGVASWADARASEGHIRYSVSSGPSIDSGHMGGAQIADVDGAGDVVNFRLTAPDQTVHLDEMMKILADFMGGFEVTASRAVISSLRAAAVAKGVSLEEPRPNGIADMTMAMRMRRKSGGGWEWGKDDVLAIVEVSPGCFDIRERSSEVA